MLQPTSFPQSPKADFFLEGPVGQLQTVSSWPKDQKPRAVIIVCHPHPLYSGSMNNKVVTTLARAADQVGLATIRFNFRGVGQSQGSYGNSIGECDDLRAVIQWVKKVLPDVPVGLAGFSFGAYIAAKLANETAQLFLLSVAPAVNHQNYFELKAITAPWLIIQGDRDEVVPYSEVIHWYQQAAPPAQLTTLAGASHFFHGRLLELQQRVEDFLKKL